MENNAARLVIRGTTAYNEKPFSFCVLRNRTCLAATFAASDIPLSEKQTRRRGECVGREEREWSDVLKGGHDCPLAVVRFRKHKGTWAIKNLVNENVSEVL